MADHHTIVLIQPTPSTATRTFSDHATVNDAIESVCEMFERKLSELNPHIPKITYDVTDLYNYIDKLTDLSALVYDPKIKAYVPCNKDWIKKKCFQHLQKLAP